MNNEPEVLASHHAEPLAAGDGLANVNPSEPVAARALGGSGFRFERRSSYCAETAWVWQRARFVCAKP